VALGAGEDAHDVAPDEEVIVAAPALAARPPLVPEGPAGDPDADVFDEEVAPLTADSTPLITVWRNGGTAASTTPTANTVTPMARAGRSMTSLQVLGRRGARRGRPAGPGRADVAGRPDHAWRQYPPSCARNPAIASRIAAILDWLA